MNISALTQNQVQGIKDEQVVLITPIDNSVSFAHMVRITNLVNPSTFQVILPRSSAIFECFSHLKSLSVQVTFPSVCYEGTIMLVFFDKAPTAKQELYQVSLTSCLPNKINEEPNFMT